MDVGLEMFLPVSRDSGLRLAILESDLGHELARSVRHPGYLGLEGASILERQTRGIHREPGFALHHRGRRVEAKGVFEDERPFLRAGVFTCQILRKRRSG